MNVIMKIIGSVMKIVKAILALVGVVVIGIVAYNVIKQTVPDPPVALTMRHGVLSDYVLQVSNLSAKEGLEVYVYIENGNASARSGNIVIPANGRQEFGRLEMVDWKFKVGDHGYVHPVKYEKKLFFEFSNEGYRTWFDYDDRD